MVPFSKLGFRLSNLCAYGSPFAEQVSMRSFNHVLRFVKDKIITSPLNEEGHTLQKHRMQM